MNKKAIFAVSIVASLVFFALGAYTYAFSTTTQTWTETISPSAAVPIQLQLEEGSRVQGDLVVVDGNQGVKISIVDPNNQVAYDGGTVYTSLEFTFIAQTSGAHTVNLDNLSTVNQQTVELSITQPAFSATISIILIIVGALLLILGIATLFLRTR